MVYIRVGNKSIECYMQLKLPNIRKLFDGYILLSVPKIVRRNLYFLI